MKPRMLPLAAVMVAALGCGNSKTQSGPGGNIGAGGSGGDPIGGGPDSGGDGGGNAACSVVGEELRVTQSGAASRMPGIAWDGAGFLVVWSDERNGNGDLYAARIGADGKKSSEWPIVEGAENSISPSIARLGSSGFLVTWFDKTPLGADVKSIVLGADGKATGMPTMLSPTTSDNPRPIAASAFGGAAVAWMDKKGTIPTASVALLNASGQLSIPAVSLGSATAGAEFPAPASGDNLLAVFYSDARDGHLNIRVSLFNDKLVSQNDVLVRDAANDAVNTRATWDGDQFIAAWEDLRNTESEQVYAARVSPKAAVSTPVAAPELGEDANFPSLAATRQGTAIAYYQFRGGPPQIYISYMNKDGQLARPDLQVSRTNGKARYPSIAFDGSSLLGVAWEDTRSGHQEVYFARVHCQ